MKRQLLNLDSAITQVLKPSEKVMKGKFLRAIGPLLTWSVEQQGTGQAGQADGGVVGLRQPSRGFIAQKPE